MPVYTFLIKPASGLCNMHCDYCFYCDETSRRSICSYGMMSEETLKNLIKKALLQAEGEVCFAFQGGEPTLRGLAFFQKAVEFENQYNCRQIKILNTLQTNGLALNEEWCRFFQKHHFLIGVSIDGLKMTHDLHRHDTFGNPTYDRIRQNIRLLEQYGIDFNILTVVTRQSAEKIRDIYLEYKKNNWHFQQYIACLDPFLDEPGKQAYSLTPEVYGKFLIDLFRLWEKDWRRNKAPYIRQFENYIGILLGYPPEACEQSGICSVQCVAEANGNAYPCDFYAMDEYCLGNYNTAKIAEFFKSDTARRFVQESQKHSPECMECPWFSLCRNGCRRHRIRDSKTGRYQNYFCKSYRMFFEQHYERMLEIADWLKNSRV